MANYFDIMFNSTVIAGLIIGACVLLFSYILRSYKTDKKDNSVAKNKPPIRTEKRKEPESQKKKKRASRNHWLNSGKQQHFSHPWLSTSFKGHAGEVLDIDFSSNGKYLATCSEDRTVIIWEVKDYAQKQFKSVRVYVEHDHANFVKWSPDNKAFLVNRFNDGQIQVYKMEKKKTGGIGNITVAHTFPKLHKMETVGMSIASNGKFIMSCSSQNDLVLWDLKGNVIAKVDTCMMTTFCAKISPCGKFVLASGFSPDAIVWEVVFNNKGEYQEVKRAYELTGHRSGIYDIACNVDSSQMVTVSKDGTWRLFDTGVEYKKGQDPRFKMSGHYKNPEEDPAIVALHDGVVVVAVNNSIHFFSAFTGQLDQTIDNIYEEKITRVAFESSGRYVLVSGPRHVLVFHNVTGYKCDIYKCQEKLKDHQTSATKERLLQIIKDSREFLANISK